MWIIPANLVDLTTKATITSTISTDTSEHDQKISFMWDTIHQTFTFSVSTGSISILFFVLVATVLVYYIRKNQKICIQQMQQTQPEPVVPTSFQTESETLIELLNLPPPPYDKLYSITSSSVSLTNEPFAI
jgi:hypothetical protein